jgi:hypothetical protein
MRSFNAPGIDPVDKTYNILTEMMVVNFPDALVTKHASTIKKHA